MNNVFCPGCGTKVESNDTKFCTTCGYGFEQNQTANQNYDINSNFATSEGVKNYTNGMGIAGLVISIVSLIFCCGSISLIGLIFSLIGLKHANKNNGVGKGISIAGLIINIVGLLLMLFWVLIVCMPYVSRIIEKSTMM